MTVLDQSSKGTAHDAAAFLLIAATIFVAAAWLRHRRASSRGADAGEVRALFGTFILASVVWAVLLGIWLYPLAK